MTPVHIDGKRHVCEALPGAKIGKIGHPKPVGPRCHELTVHPVARGNFFSADGGATYSDPVLITQGIHQDRYFFQGGELRLRKIRGSLAQNIVAAAQRADFPLQLLQALAFIRRESTITTPGIPLMLAKTGTKRLRCTANLRGKGAEGSSL